jgi:class 3 adenylate cyclase
MNFTAISREVNLAKRLEEEAKPGQVLIGPGTYALLDLVELGLEPQQVVSNGRRRLRGFDQPVEVYEIFGGPAPRAPVGLEVVRILS